MSPRWLLLFGLFAVLFGLLAMAYGVATSPLFSFYR